MYETCIELIILSYCLIKDFLKFKCNIQASCKI